MNDVVSSTGEVPAGTLPEVVNQVWEVPSLALDGISAVTITTHVAKITFAEHFADGNALKARNVANLVIPIDQFMKIVTALGEIAAQFANSQSEES